MSASCSLEGCFADTTCALGYLCKTECENWDESENGEGAEVSQEEAVSSDLPWNGFTLGTLDLAVIGGRCEPYVLGLVGPPESGKTSLLAFLYMWLLKHGKVGKWSFAGSWTLGGWESIVQHSRWTGEPPPSFPPHTSSAGRYPGILHLALRCGHNGLLRDVLFTDAPGEWYTRWAAAPDVDHAEGARWVIEHSDALLLLIDSGALANQEKVPETRRVTRDLCERVAAKFDGPIGATWTKSDIRAIDTVRDAIERSLSQHLPEAHQLQTRVDDASTIAGAVERMLDEVFKSRGLAPIEERTLSNDPFLAYRGGAHG